MDVPRMPVPVASGLRRMGEDLGTWRRLRRLTAAQALSNLALTLAQALGLVLLAPLLLKTTGPPPPVTA